MTKRETIDVPLSSPWAVRAKQLLVCAQSLLLAFYKREYVSGGNHPPLVYWIEVLAQPYVRTRSKTVLATYQVSPDSIREDSRLPGWNARGAFFELGRGWILPEANFTCAILLLQPRRSQVLRHSYQFVS